MRRSVLLPILVAGLVQAGSLRFQPDTVQHGYGYSTSTRVPDSTKVRCLSASASVTTLRLKRLIAPFKHPAKSAVLFSAPSRREYAYRIDSAVAAGARFVHHLSRDTNYLPRGAWTRAEFGDTKAPDLQLAPNEAVVLRRFRLEDCEQVPTRALATTYPATRCRDEPTDFVFETGVTGFDTLHVVSNNWSTGVQDRVPLAGPSTGTRYTLDGKRHPWMEPRDIRSLGTVVEGARAP